MLAGSLLFQFIMTPRKTVSGDLYTSEKNGSDESGDGSKSKPYKTIMRAMTHAGGEPFPTIYVDGKDDVQVFASSAYKNYYTFALLSELCITIAFVCVVV